MLTKVTKTEKGYRIETLDDGSDKSHISVEDLTWITQNLKNPDFKKAYEEWIKSDLPYMKAVI